MLEINYMLIYTMINIVILYILFRKFLFKPITNIIEERAKLINDEICEAKNKNELASKNLQESEDTLSSSKKEGAEIVLNAKKSANTAYEEIVADAKDEASDILKKAHDSIEVEKANMYAEVKEHVSTLTAAATNRVLKNVSHDENDEIIDELLAEMGDDNA